MPPFKHLCTARCKVTPELPPSVLEEGAYTASLLAKVRDGDGETVGQHGRTSAACKRFRLALPPGELEG